MRTFLLALFILMVVGALAWYRFNGFKLPTNKFLEKEQVIAPFNKWEAKLIGTWDYKREYESPLSGCLDEGEVEYRTDGTFRRYSNIKQYYTNSPTYSGILNSSYQWYTGGGTVSGDWTIDTLKGAIDELEKNCQIRRSWIKDGWKENIHICDTYYVMYSPALGNFEGSDEKRWIEKFTNDSIIVRGRDFASDMNIVIRLKKRP